MKKELNCIMMIDDDAPTNYISTEIIEESGCTRHYQIVDSALKALAYLENAAPEENAGEHNILPDLIFLDINMPRINGWEFLDKYKKLKNGYLEKPVIIMLTTSLNPDDRQKAESLPEVAGYESKPLTAEMIERVIKTYFNSGSVQKTPTGSIIPVKQSA